MSKLDELFREKLINHSVTPSSEAWGNIENRLSKKNRPVVWMRWAAIFLLGGLFLSILLLQQPQSPATMTETKSLPQTKEQKEPNTRITPPSAMAQGQPAIKKETRKKQTTNPVNKSEAEEQVTDMVKAGDPIASTTEPVNVPVPNVTENTNAPSSIVLVYTLESVEATTSENPESIAAASDRKDSSLKRVLNFANNIKNSDSPLENIRTAKEDLFALDFKKKNNNKKH